MKKNIPITSKMCMTRDVGTEGNLFGGNMMAWMDEAASIFARIYTGMPHLVTLKFSEVQFRRMVKVGQIVEFFASNPKVGRTSFSFDLEARVDEDVVFHTSTTFVALDEEGNPTEIKR